MGFKINNSSIYCNVVTGIVKLNFFLSSFDEIYRKS